MHGKLQAADQYGVSKPSQQCLAGWQHCCASAGKAAFQQQGGPCLLVVQHGILGTGGDDATILDDVL